MDYHYEYAKLDYQIFFGYLVLKMNLNDLNEFNNFNDFDEFNDFNDV